MNDLDSQFADGVYLCLLSGLLEGYFVPLYDFHLTPQVKKIPPTNITDIGIYCKLCPQFLWIFNPFFIASPLTKKLPTSAWLLSWWWMEVYLSPKLDRRTLSTWTWSQHWGCSTICSPSTNISARTPLTTSSGAVWPTNQPALSLSQSAELDLTASLTSLNIQKPSWSAMLCLQTASYFYFV